MGRLSMAKHGLDEVPRFRLKLDFMAEATRKLKRCPVCGASGVPLERVHIVPVSKGGSSTPDNFIFLCANCHAQVDRGEIREFEFVSTLLELMRSSGRFGNLSEEAKLDDRVRVDISAFEKDGGRRLLIECKSSSVINSHRSREFADRLQAFRAIIPDAEIILAVPTRLDPRARSIFAQTDISVWDLDEIARLFRDHLGEVKNPVLRAMLLGVSALDDSGTPLSAEARLIDELTAMPPGREAWSPYQRLIARILERLFVPPLSSPLSDHSDEDRRNRRDIVLPNYSESGFWAFMRSRYAADFIVVDAKNYTEEIGKEEAMQILHYLKEDGAGMFGILISRKGSSEACQHVLTTHWIRHGKLVISLSDEEVIQMLRLKEAGATPETVIRQAIEDFRLST